MKIQRKWQSVKGKGEREMGEEREGERERERRRGPGGRKGGREVDYKAWMPRRLC